MAEKTSYVASVCESQVVVVIWLSKSNYLSHSASTHTVRVAIMEIIYVRVVFLGCGQLPHLNITALSSIESFMMDVSHGIPFHPLKVQGPWLQYALFFCLISQEWSILATLDT